jgi:hypothetical protein
MNTNVLDAMYTSSGDFRSPTPMLSNTSRASIQADGPGVPVQSTGGHRRSVTAPTNRAPFRTPP